MPQQCHHPIIHTMVKDMVTVEDTIIDPGSVSSDDWSGYVTPFAGDLG